MLVGKTKTKVVFLKTAKKRTDFLKILQKRSSIINLDNQSLQ
jgi:hypothetical protein